MGERPDPLWWWKTYEVMTVACITAVHQIPSERFPGHIGFSLKVCKLFCLLLRFLFFFFSQFQESFLGLPCLLDSWAENWTQKVGFKKQGVLSHDFSPTHSSVCSRYISSDLVWRKKRRRVKLFVKWVAGKKTGKIRVWQSSFPGDWNFFLIYI